MNQVNKEKRLKAFRIILIFWTLFIGLGAVLGSTCMEIDPTGKIMGMETLLPYFQVLPFADALFQNYIFPGIALLIINGLSNLTASIFLFLKKKTGYILGTVFGITLMMWIIIQFVIFPANFMSTIYFIFGFLQMVSGICCLIFYRQTQFKFDIKDYPGIQKESAVLVLYFSRMGYTKKVAYNAADLNKAPIEEITTDEKTSGTLGFWWSGRFGMHRWPMKTNKLTHDLSRYKKIIIVSPIWVFHISAPVRDIIQRNTKTLSEREVEFHLVHFMNFLFPCTRKEISRYLPGSKVISYRSHYGNIKKEDN